VTNVFDIQSDVASQIARVLATAMSADELSLIGERPTTSLAAWQSFITARSIYQSRVRGEDIEKSMSLVDAAIADDPTFARAHSLRAALLFSRAMSMDSAAHAKEVLQSAMTSANYALELAASTGDFILSWHSARLRAARNTADHCFDAIARAPNNADGRFVRFVSPEAGYLERAWAEKTGCRMIRCQRLSPGRPRLLR
jgi:hypothetical protein